MGRRSNTDTRRQQIVDALAAEMAEGGYARASTRSIAERAGLASGLVHYHFSSKEAILLALLEQLIASADARFEAGSQGARLPRAILVAFVSARLGLGGEPEAQQVGLWVNLIAEAMGMPEVRHRLSAWFARDLRRLARLFRQCGVREPGAKAATLLSMLLGSFSLHAIGVPGVPRGYAEAQALAWLGALLAE